MTELDYAYLAGIIDGEGSISLVKGGARSRNRYPAISVSSTTYEIIDYLKNLFGGYICKHKKTKNNHSQAWSWRIDNDNAIELLCHIIHFMKEPEKIRRGKLIIEHYKNNTVRNGWYTEEQMLEKEKFIIDFFKNSKRVKIEICSISSAITRRKK